MSFSTAEGIGALRRERLRSARLYFVCDAHPGDQDPEPLLKAALDGGVDIVQLREKSGDRRVTDRAAQTFRRLCDTYGVPFMVNDDPELAVSCRADGVHIGQDDMSVEDARSIVGNDCLIGLSTHSEEQILAAHQAEHKPDHISVGPVWETPTKPGRPAVGLELVNYAASHATLPFFAIGGIDPNNVGEVLTAGARRICVVRAIRNADDPTAVAASLRRAFAAVGAEVAPGG
jgi:thiamine-phosphate pyrophosphorylase